MPTQKPLCTNFLLAEQINTDGEYYIRDENKVIIARYNVQTEFLDFLGAITMNYNEISELKQMIDILHEAHI